MGELMGHKGVNLGIILAKVAKWPFGLPKGHLAGGECFAPLGALPLREGGGAKHSPPGDASELGALPLEEGGGAKHSPQGDTSDKIW